MRLSSPLPPSSRPRSAPRSSSRPRAAFAFIATLAVVAPACSFPRDAAVPLVRAHASRDLDCAEDDIRVQEELTGYYKAIGCGRKARYRYACVGLTCTVSGEDEKAIPWRDRPDPGPQPSPQPGSYR